MSKRAAVWLLLALLLAGLGLRVFELTARSMWFDESFTWRLLQFSWSEMLSRAATDVHPPLYYIAVRMWAALASDSLFSLRAFSVICSLLTITLVYAVVETSYHNRKLALLAAALTTIAGNQIFYAQEARMYMLGLVLALFSTLCLVKTTQARASHIWSLGYAVGITALAYTHYFGLFIIAGQVVWVIAAYAAAWRHNKPMNGARSVALAYAASFLAYLPWLPTFMKQRQQVQESFWIPDIAFWSVPDSFYRMYIPTSVGPLHQTWQDVALALVPIIFTASLWLALIASHRIQARQHRAATWLIVLSGAAPIAISAGLSLVGPSLYQDRYIVFSHPFILMTGAAALWFFTTSDKKIRISATIALIIFFSIGTLNYWQQLNIADKPGLAAAMKYVADNITARDGFLINSPFIFFAADYYATHEFPSSAKPRLYAEGSLSHFAGGPVVTAQDVMSGAFWLDFKGSDVWIIDTTGFGASPIAPPKGWQLTSKKSYPEVFGYQGDILVSRYVRVR